MFLFGPPNIEKLKMKADIPGLARALQHKDRDIRLKAAAALGELARIDGVGPLLASLSDESSGVRDQAVQSLGRIALQHNDPAVRARIVDALVPLLELQELSTRHLVAEIFGQLGPGAGVDGLFRALELKNPPILEVAAQLGKIGDKRCIDGLVRIMQEESYGAYARVHTASQLLQFGKVDPRAVVFLAGWLSSADDRMALEACKVLESNIWAFQNLGSAQTAVEEALLAALNSTNSAIQAFTIRRLGGYKSRRAVEPLLKSLGNMKPELRQEAADSLGCIGDRRAVPALVKLLSDGHRGVALAAQRALEDNNWLIQSKEARLSIALDREDWVTVLVETGPEMSDLQETMQRITKGEGRAALIRMLVQKNDPRWCEATIQGLTDPSAKVREQAAGMLETHPDPRALPALLSSLEDEAEKVRLACVRALGMLADPAAVPALAQALRTSRSSDAIRQQAILALVGSGAQGQAALADLLTEADATVNRLALDALKRKDAPELGVRLSAWLGLVDGDIDRVLRAGEVGEALCISTLSKSSPEVHSQLPTAIQALARRATPQAVKALVEAFRVWPVYQDRILLAFAKEKNPAAVEPLAALLDQPELETVAAQALAEYHDPRAFDGLLKLVKSSLHGKTRRKAAAHLVEIYKNGSLSNSQKQELLSLRELITATHEDTHSDYRAPQNCSTVFNTNEHDDYGIGVDFPL